MKSREGKKRGEAARGSGNDELTFVTIVTYSSKVTTLVTFEDQKTLYKVGMNELLIRNNKTGNFVKLVPKTIHFYVSV